MISAHKELDAFLDRKATVFHLAIMNLARAKFTGGDLQGARKDLAETIQRTLILADLKGRERLLMEFDAAQRGAKFADIPTTSPIVPGITFEEAVENMLKREPRLARSAAEVSRLYSTQKVFAMARSAEMTVTRRAQEEITKWLSGGTPGAAIEKTLTEIGPFSEAYAATVYRTNVAESYNLGRIEQAKDEDVSDIIVGFRFEGVLDAFTRPNHSAGFGSIAATDDPVWKLHRPPLGYNSFVAGTLVSGRFDGASKALYSGPVVDITTRKGCRLTVTTNHPILTSLGYARAASIGKGQYLAVHLPSVESLIAATGNGIVSDPFPSGRAVDDQEMPARIEDVFDSFLSERAASTVEWFADTLPLDFHGDAGFYKGKVHIISADGMLPANVFARSLEHPKQLALMERDGAALLSRHGSGVDWSRKFVRIGVASNLDASTDQSIHEAAARGVKLLGKLQERYPGEVAFDQVVSVDIRPYSGHVYDLQSPNGWIVSQGIFASNCRCSLEFVSRFEAERLGLWKDEKLVRHVASSAAWFPDPGFKGEGV